MSKHTGMRRIATIGGALALAVALPLGALAEIAEPITPTTPAALQAVPGVDASAAPAMPQAPMLTGRGGRGGAGIREFGIGGFGAGMGIETSTANMTEAQQAAYQDALSAYIATEDEQLANLVAAGVLTQDEADAHKAQRANRQALGEIDMSKWTDEQKTALKEALDKPDEERAQALSALADGLQLTQAQSGALGALVGNQTSLWQQISGQTDEATLDALDAMQHAQLSFMQALGRAGIGGRGADGANEKIERGFRGVQDFVIDARDAKRNAVNGSANGGIGRGF